MKPVRFKMKYETTINGNKTKGIEEEASWFYLDQRGKIYSNSPMRPILPCEHNYDKLTPLLKVNDEYLSIEEIEDRMNMFEFVTDGLDLEELRENMREEA